jgi:hypothetical protein
MAGLHEADIHLMHELPLVASSNVIGGEQDA